MITYKQYEEKIYTWLSSKNTQNREFTFSIRRNSAKGAEGDYFIGTEKSGYFATTFWFLPVNFPGSSGDCIALIFRYSEKGLNYCFEFTQTKTPHNEQNTSALNLCKSLEETLSIQPGLQRASSDDAKMFTFLTKPKQRNYQSVDDLTRDIDAELNHVINSVNKKIEEEKKQNPSFTAHRITPTEFANNNAKMNDRIERFAIGNKPSEKSNSRYWLYSPGEQAYLWDEYYEKGIMALGWDDLGDLSKYKSKQEIEKELQRLDNTSDSKKNNAVANYDFVNTLAKGDYIIVKKGRGKLLGYGIVTSDLYYDDTVEEYYNRRKVDWKIKGEWTTDHDLVLKTLTDITNYSTEDPNFVKYYEKLMSIMEGNHLTIKNKNFEKINYSLNQILYGPPGTGKTFNSINKAIEIINPNFDLNQDRSLIKDEHDRLVLENQIVFTTFHQSMSYEDFIEGIKPETKDGNVTYDVIPGLFLELCSKAESNWEDSKQGNKTQLSFEEAFLTLKEEWDENEGIRFPLKRDGNDFTILGFTKKSIQFKKASGGTGHTLSINTLKEYYYKKREVRPTGVGIYYPAILDKLNSYEPIAITEKKLKNYVIIIDEINRGNVSAIFGELITLIEEDKRLGKDEALEVMLPYSKEKFGVPPNVYIIGTMNTADRSVEALDTALRRRFSFVEMMPNQKVIEEKAFSDFDRVFVMQKINQRIELLLDRNYTLGHSYFIKSAFKKSFENEIIPLLQEYFYNDYGKIGLVLGRGFVREKAISISNSVFADFETKNDIDVAKGYELIPFNEVNFDLAIETLLGN